MSKILEVKDLTKKYSHNLAADSVSFSMEKGDIFALIGPNGAGKTTTIRMISTLIQPTSGDAFIDGHSIVTEPEKVRECITYLPDEAGAYKNMTGIKYLKFMAGFFAANDTEIEKYVKRASDMSKLGDKLNDKVSTYSRGMTRKLLLSRAVMTSPKLAILDEPTSGLDVINALEIRNDLKNLAKQGMSFLISSHNMLEIEYMSTKVGIINHGNLICIGKPDELKAKYNVSNLEEVFEKVVTDNEVL